MCTVLYCLDLRCYLLQCASLVIDSINKSLVRILRINRIRYVLEPLACGDRYGRTVGDGGFTYILMAINDCELCSIIRGPLQDVPSFM